MFGTVTFCETIQKEGSEGFLCLAIAILSLLYKEEKNADTHSKLKEITLAGSKGAAGALYLQPYRGSVTYRPTSDFNPEAIYSAFLGSWYTARQRSRSVLSVVVTVKENSGNRLAFIVPLAGALLKGELWSSMAVI